MTNSEKLESAINKALTYMERSIQDVDEAVAKGKVVVQVSCAKDTRRGDIIEISPIIPEGEEPEIMQARVIAVNPASRVSNETPDFTFGTQDVYKVYHAICVILEPGDFTTEEEFAALYTEEASEEAQEALEQPDPDICSCGADRLMCERNQNVFGGHLQ